METTRHEHLKWCKQRALEYIKFDDLDQAFASMVSDLGKHDETVGHMGINMGVSLKMGGLLQTNGQMKEWIIGFN